MGAPTRAIVFSRGALTRALGGFAGSVGFGFGGTAEGALPVARRRGSVFATLFQARFQDLEVAARDAGALGGVGDVARVPIEDTPDVTTLEFDDDTLARFPERQRA